MADNTNNATNVHIVDDYDNSTDKFGDTDKKEEIEGFTDTLHKTATTVSKTLPKVTRYERARIIGVRTRQIAEGMEPKIDVKGLTDPYEIAIKEFDEGKTPLIIQRRLPGGEVENVRVSDLVGK